MMIYRLSKEAESELRFAVDLDTSGPVRIAIDDGLKVKVGEGAWSRPLDVAIEGKPDELPLQDLRAVLDYNWADEEADYQDNPSPRHVFLAMQRLDNWLTDFEPSS